MRGQECQAGPDSLDGALTPCVAPSNARAIEDAAEEKREWEVFGGQDREGVSVESDPDPHRLQAASAARRLSGEKEAKKSPVTIRNCSACSVVALRTCRPSWNAGGSARRRQGPWPSLPRNWCQRNESVRCVRCEDQAEEDGKLYAPEDMLLEPEVRELPARAVGKLFRELRFAPEFVVHLRRGIGQ